jgi:ribosome-binding factor A
MREFSDIVRGLKDPRVRFVTVVDTDLSPDLRYATMYFSVIGSEEDIIGATKALQGATGYIRREVAKRLSMRYTPEINVAYDETAERASRITSLIDRAIADEVTAVEDGESPS